MRYLSFSIENRKFGAPLSQVREVIAFPEISALPNMLQGFVGITNLRGQIIPILDLRIRFQTVPSLTHDTAVIICNMESRQVGLIVDSIHGVHDPAENEILSLKHMQGEGMTSSPVTSVINKDKELCLILDMQKMVSSMDLDMGELQKTFGQLKNEAS